MIPVAVDEAAGEKGTCRVVNSLTGGRGDVAILWRLVNWLSREESKRRRFGELHGPLGSTEQLHANAW
jgi:hypothetical protein